MPYEAPTLSDFKARFPAFGPLGDDNDLSVQAALDDAASSADSSWPDADRLQAVMLLAAHNLTLDGIGNGTEAQLAGFRRLKIGSLELESATAAASASSSPLLQTGYGRRFAELVRRVRGPTILVV